MVLCGPYVIYVIRVTVNSVINSINSVSELENSQKIKQGQFSINFLYVWSMYVCYVWSMYQIKCCWLRTHILQMLSQMQRKAYVSTSNSAVLSNNTKQYTQIPPE